MAISAKNFIGSVLANVDNELLTDKAFREFIRNSLYVVEKPELKDIINSEIKKRMGKYYDGETTNMNKNEIGISVDIDIKRIISELTLIDIDDINDIDSLEYDLEFDSLDIVDLVIEIENHFNIEFEDDEIDNWTNILVADVINRVRKKLV